MMNTTVPQLAHLAIMMADASIDRVMAIDTQWRIIVWNKMSELISGFTKGEILGRLLLEVFPALQADEEMMEAFRGALEGKKHFLESKPGLFNRSHYENHFIPLAEENGLIIGVMNIMHDVAHRIKAERELQKLNAALKDKYLQLEKASGELATFTAITGTELKAPIRNVYTALEYLVTNEGQSFSHSGRANLRRIQASLNRMNLLLDDILAMSSASSFSQQFTEVKVDQLLQEVAAVLQDKLVEKNAVIEAGELPALRGSKQMLHYLLLNIIDNILRLHEQQTPIRITVSGDQVLLKDHSNNITGQKQYCCISFVNNAVAKETGNREKTFSTLERAHTGKQHSGPGFTLTMCRKIAEAHGGYIEAESVPGKGVSFYCYITASPTASPGC